MRVVAEIGLGHDGSLGNALKLVDACADAGVDACKFQCHEADPQSQFRPGTWFPQDADRQAYWKRTGFSVVEWNAVRQRCSLMGVEFGVSCFSPQAVEMMRIHRPDFWKVGSAQATDKSIRRMIDVTNRPIVISSGMSDWAELEAAIRFPQQERFACDREITVLQCASKYPTKPDDVGLNVMAELRERFGCKVGLSDHSGTIWPGIVAAYLGADMLEVHVCWDKRQWGPDVSSSLTIDELAQLVRGIRFVERLRPVDKDEAAAGMEEMRKLFRGMK